MARPQSHVTKKGGRLEYGKTLQRLRAEASLLQLESASLSLLGHNFHFLLTSREQEVKKKPQKNSIATSGAEM